ncbi:MAG: hypothetical protein J0H94_10995 [Rhizobiales bacterium]|nr:hypothetical protein [Hyphomicrobiales bacterium]
MNTFRTTLIAAAVLVAASAGAMGLMTSGAETREADATSLCAAADWPLIPAECLGSGAKRNVRVIGDEAVARDEPAESQVAMQARFETAFQ